jgi:hypothetical protein
MKKLFVSFSGGETSGFMAQWIKANIAREYDKVIYLFANTGQENESTLKFVDQCDKAFNLGVVWVEAKVIAASGSGTSYTVVDYKTADRDGKVFEDVIKKYGIPNKVSPGCTRDLKLNPMTSYLRSIGWKNGTYDTAIGIRSDEIDRMSVNAKNRRLIYPLISQIEMTKPRINIWWQRQPFRLNLKGYEGNCKWCWKKSMRKHLTLINEHPEWYDFPERMESEHALAGPNKEGFGRVFFRSSMSTKDLRNLAALGGFTPASDDAKTYEDQMSLGFDLDTSNGCSESCEIDFK